MDLTSERDYADFIHTYALDVINGTVPASKWVKYAAQRHLDDLARSVHPSDLQPGATPPWPYYFSKNAARKVCRFAELFPHVKGQWAKRKELITLQPWEMFLLGLTFGWLTHGTDLRRFRELYWCIPRKNGKSILGAIIAIYMLIADGEVGAEVYSGATTEKQAMEVFAPAKAMLETSPDILAEAGVEIAAKSVFVPATYSKFQPVIGNPGDGPSPSCSIIDEFHEHQTSNLYDTMVTGQGARQQPLTVIITTAGVTMAGPCYFKHREAQRVLEGTVVNDQLFACVFTVDEQEGDDWADPMSLRKANPNFGVSVDAEFLLAQQRQAVLNPEYQNRFKTKHLNIWTSAKTAWMNMEWWRLCGDRQLVPSELQGATCWFVLDLASRLDICVFMKLYRTVLNGQYHYYAFGKYYLPEATLEEPGPNQTTYKTWHNAGFLTVTEGQEINFDYIRDEVVAETKLVSPEEVVYDPWRAVHLAQQLAGQGANVVEYRNTVQTMSPPMKELMAAVKSCRFHHDANPILTWMMGNVVAKEDAKENIYPRKEKNEMKIDGPVAIIMGMGRAMTNDSTMQNFGNWVTTKPVLA